ncbi:MAG: helix-turn-helix domain-containing protein [Ignavibacteriaceae bacterium]
MEKENSFAGVLTKLNELEKLLKRNHDTPLNFVQAAQYLSISHSHLYKMTSQRKIPFHKPSGKYLFFFKYELDAWIHQNDPNPHPEGEGIGEQKPDNEPGLFDEEIGNEDKIEPP